MTTHELKTWPNYFQLVWSGRKTFEVRYDDRGYQRGDTVVLREWDRHWPCECTAKHHDPDCKRYTGRTITAEVGHVMASTPTIGGQRGFVGQGYVVLALRHPQLHPTNPTPTPVTEGTGPRVPVPGPPKSGRTP